ncbi:hypothetical protein AeMF1_007320 [Aphanomyces euteiches]|nr:hypothetical protein AeMF1_007320 [Aphanomyces euteiches]
MLSAWNWYVLVQMDVFRAFLPQDVCDSIDLLYGDVAPDSMNISTAAGNASNHVSRWTSWKLDPAKVHELTHTETKGQEALERAIKAFQDKHKEPLKTTFYACGKRGILYEGTSASHSPVLIKVQKLDQHNSIDRESYWLRRLNRFRLGPTLVAAGPGFFICQFFTNGLNAVEFLSHPDTTQADVAWFLRRILHQCFVLDVLGINKAEMTHPMRHIIVHDSSCSFVDFEKCVYGAQPRNVTQLCQFLSSPRIVAALSAKGHHLNVSQVREMAKKYKQTPGGQAFQALLDCISRRNPHQAS